MPEPKLAYRDRADLPKLSAAPPTGPLVLDTNVFINILAAREPPALRALLAEPPAAFVSGPTIAELYWAVGRLDPAHPNTAQVVADLLAALDRVAPELRLTPTVDEWREAGELAGRAARGLAGPARSVMTPQARAELINDAITAVVARAVGATVITQDGDFDLFAQLDPTLRVVFYD